MSLLQFVLLLLFISIVVVVFDMLLLCCFVVDCYCFDVRIFMIAFIVL